MNLYYDKVYSIIGGMPSCKLNKTLVSMFVCRLSQISWFVLELFKTRGMVRKRATHAFLLNALTGGLHVSRASVWFVCKILQEQNKIYKYMCHNVIPLLDLQVYDLPSILRIDSRYLKSNRVYISTDVLTVLMNLIYL